MSYGFCWYPTAPSTQIEKETEMVKNQVQNSKLKNYGEEGFRMQNHHWLNH